MSMSRIAMLAMIALSLVCGGCQTVTTVILVRHAERAPGSQDPPLSAAGQQRAETLAKVVSGAGVETIYATQFQRTQQTAAPTATATGVMPVIISVNGPVSQHASEVASRVMADNKNRTALVCSHSNIVHLIAQELGAPGVAPLSESEYDRLIIIVKRGNQTRIIQGRYGQP